MCWPLLASRSRRYGPFASTSRACVESPGTHGMQGRGLLAGCGAARVGDGRCSRVHEHGHRRIPASRRRRPCTGRHHRAAPGTRHRRAPGGRHQRLCAACHQRASARRRAARRRAVRASARQRARASAPAAPSQHGPDGLPDSPPGRIRSPGPRADSEDAAPSNLSRRRPALPLSRSPDAGRDAARNTCR